VVFCISTCLCSKDAAAKPYRDVFTGALWKYRTPPELNHHLVVITHYSKINHPAFKE